MIVLNEIKTEINIASKERMETCKVKTQRRKDIKNHHQTHRSHQLMSEKSRGITTASLNCVRKGLKTAKSFSMASKIVFNCNQFKLRSFAALVNHCVNSIVYGWIFESKNQSK